MSLVLISAARRKASFASTLKAEFAGLAEETRLPIATLERFREAQGDKRIAAIERGS